MGLFFLSMFHNAYTSMRTAFNYLKQEGVIWNLDFLHFLKLGICLRTNTLQTLALHLAVGVYPLLLMMLLYLLIHLYDRTSGDDLETI